MLDLFNGDSFSIQNKFLKELDTAIQAIAILLTTSSPFESTSTSLNEFKGRNISDDLRPEVSIKIDRVNSLIKKDYKIIKSVTLESLEDDDANADGMIVTLAVVTVGGVVYPEITI